MAKHFYSKILFHGKRLFFRLHNSPSTTAVILSCSVPMLPFACKVSMDFPVRGPNWHPLLICFSISCLANLTCPLYKRVTKFSPISCYLCNKLANTNLKLQRGNLWSKMCWEANWNYKDECVCLTVKQRVGAVLKGERIGHSWWDLEDCQKETIVVYRALAVNRCANTSLFDLCVLHYSKSWVVSSRKCLLCFFKLSRHLHRSWPF